MSGTVAERVAAQRAFFNYSFYATTKTRSFDVTMSGAPPVGLINSSYNLSVTVPAFINLSSYSIKWTSTGTGTFSPNDFSQNVTYTPTGSANRSDEITVTLTDACGREFAASTVTYMSGVLAQKQILLKAERKTDQHVQLTWQSNQANIAAYEIEKDENNSGFKTVAVLLFKGVENSIYTFVDNCNSTSQLYRLKVIDVNGNYFYSSIARVNGETSNSLGISILGNPVRNIIKLAYQVSTPQIATIELVDTRGRKILQQDTRLSPSRSALEIELPSTIINGEYFLRVKTKDVQENARILVQ
jgi:hypothetical protein